MSCKRAAWLLGVALMCAGVATAQVAAVRPESLAAPRSAPAPRARQSFGTTADSLVRVGSMEFQPAGSDEPYADLLQNQSTWSRYSKVNLNALQALVHVPSGAFITGVELDWCNTNQDPGMTVLLTPFLVAYDGSYLMTLPSVVSDGPSGCGFNYVDLTASNVTIDNNVNQLILNAYFGAHDGTNSISGATVHYRLQVSPAPLMATFPDVATSDFGFQYVEALVASGITGGCGGGNFCPDAPVTRRQMAIFLSKALGLQWR